MSAFWTQKINTYFTRIDFDGDGVLTRKDFEAMAARFAETGKLLPDRATHLKETLTAVWDKYLSTVGGGDSIDRQTFHDSLLKLVKDPTLKATLAGPLPLFFEAVDANNDKFISADEFTEFFQILGLKPELAPPSFKAIDTNNDGLLSLEEFVEAGSDFFISEDEQNNTRLFWGPLV